MITCVCSFVHWRTSLVFVIIMQLVCNQCSLSVFDYVFYKSRDAEWIILVWEMMLYDLILKLFWKSINQFESFLRKWLSLFFSTLRQFAFPPPFFLHLQWTCSGVGPSCARDASEQDFFCEVVEPLCWRWFFGRTVGIETSEPLVWDTPSSRWPSCGGNAIPCCCEWNWVEPGSLSKRVGEPTVAFR